jgi:glycosyltransferase
MKISIITCALNSEITIKKSIRSIQKQNYKNIEHLIIDGGSTDKTLEIIKKIKKKDLNLYSSRDNGFYNALNKGIKYSKGSIVGVLHSDDFYKNNDILKIIVDTFKHTKADLVYGDLIYVKKQHPFKPIRYWKAGQYSKEKLFKGWMPPHPTVFVKKKIFDKIGFYKKHYKISADYDFLVRIFNCKNINQVYVPKVLINMRVGGMSNGSFKNLIIKSFEDYKIIKKNKIGGLLTLFYKNFSKLRQFFNISTSIN